MASTPPLTHSPPVRHRRPRRLPVSIRSSSSQTPTFPVNPYNPDTVAGRRMIRWRDDPGYPTPLDQWIQANISSWARADPRLPTTSLFPEEVLCQLKKVCRPSEPDANELFTVGIDNSILLLTISLPPESGVLVWWQKSPAAILEHHEGYYNDIFAPDWYKSMENDEEITFKQPRGIISDLFAWLALEPININEGLSEPMLRWSEAVSVARYARMAIKSRTSYSRLTMHTGPRPPRTPSRRTAWPYEYTERTRRSRLSDCGQSSYFKERLGALEFGMPVVDSV